MNSISVSKDDENNEKDEDSETLKTPSKGENTPVTNNTPISKSTNSDSSK